MSNGTRVCRLSCLVFMCASVVFLCMCVWAMDGEAGTHGSETRVSANESDSTYPSIYEDKIVWSEKIGNQSDIFLYDIGTHTETRITDDSYRQGVPVIYGDIIVWMDNRNGNWDIYMYEISKKKETQITTNQSNQSFPDIRIQ